MEHDRLKSGNFESGKLEYGKLKFDELEFPSKQRCHRVKGIINNNNKIDCGL